MRVTFVNPSGALGGGERSLLDLISALRTAEPNLAISLVVLADGPLAAQATELGVDVVRVPMPDALARIGDSVLAGKGGIARMATLAFRMMFAAPAGVAFLLALRGTLARLAPDVVHSNGIKAHLLTAVVRPRGARLIWHLRDFLGARRMVPHLARPLAGRADCLVAISRAVAADATQVFPGRRLELVYNGIDVAGIALASTDLTEINEAPGEVRFGLLATFARWKGHEVFIRAAALAARALPEGAASFFIIGGPVYGTVGGQVRLEELQAAAAAAKAPITFLPFQDDPTPVLHALDVVVHASSAPEPFGRTIVEAMAAGRAVIATAAGGVPELVHDGEEALLVPPGDV
jgi:glycosyltransferase involved in cell wall biosynthesis